MSQTREGFTKKGSGIGGRIFLFLFGTPFFALGAFFTWMGGIQPILRNLDSKSWEEVPCRIVSSRVESHSSSDGTTYSVEITYTYNWRGRSYTSDRYHFADMSSGGRTGKERVVSRYPAGAERVCYVDPDHPSEAILSRDLGWIPFFVIPFGGIFALVGLGLMAGAVMAKGGLGSRSRDRGGFSDARAKTPSFLRKESKRSVPDYEPEPLLLKPEVSRLPALIGITVFALIWNGIISIFIYQVIEGFQRGGVDWFLTVFMIPFVAVGLILIFVIIYQFLALFNPRIELTLHPGTPRLGEPCLLQWRVEGNTRRLRKLTLVLEAEEIATYRRGTNTYTDRNIFEQVVISEQDAAGSIDFSGSMDFTLPGDTMHSFKANNNEVLWSIKVQGDIPRWPDVSAVFPIAVIPPQTTSV